MHTWGRQGKTQAFTKNVVAVDFFILFVPSLGFIFNFYQLNPFFPAANNCQSLCKGETVYKSPLSMLELGPDLPGAITNTANSYWSCPAVSRCFPVDTHHLWLWYSLHPHLHQWALGWGKCGESGRWMGTVGNGESDWFPSEMSILPSYSLYLHQLWSMC